MTALESCKKFSRSHYKDAGFLILQEGVSKLFTDSRRVTGGVIDTEAVVDVVCDVAVEESEFGVVCWLGTHIHIRAKN